MFGGLINQILPFKINERGFIVNTVCKYYTMPGEKDMCHQVDEFINLDDLLISSKIYAEAIYKLAK